MDASKLLANRSVVPVVVIDRVDDAEPLAIALFEAGLGAIEITLRTREALSAIEVIAKALPDMLVGAGSIRRPQQLADVKNAGAVFAVSPGASQTLLQAADDLDMPFIPGAMTPSEMIGLLEHGYRLQKFFPAELAGGYPFLKAVGAPLPEVMFMPTGGITVDNAAKYLSLDNVACIGGSWITPAALQARRDFAAIRQLALDAMKLDV
jgi:2-dehydro-3-deoxyphosphogluconate aldolase/(4S)-4-hydroxy-2-oxoglutarate aldolase